MMNKNIFTLAAFLLVFGLLFSGHAYAGSIGSGSSAGSSFEGFDVSIDRVTANGDVVSESRSNLVDDADAFSIIVEFTAVKALENGHVEAILKGIQSSDVVSDSTGTFNLARSQGSMAVLSLVLTNGLKRETDFDLIIKIVDVRGNSEQKTYGIKTKQTRSRSALDVSIDRVKVNDKVVASSRINFIDESNDFNVLVEFTALEDMEDAHVEAILKDSNSGTVVADASANFDLDDAASSSKLLSMELLDRLKQSDSFELTIKIIDAEGDSVQQTYGLKMRDGNGMSVSDLDISIDSVELEDDIIMENQNNFVIIGEGKKNIDLKVSLTSLENVEDAHIDAILAFENGDVVADATTTFDINKDQNLAKKLELPLIGVFEQNNFKLKVRIVDAEGNFEEKLYGLKLSQQKFPFVISSISLNPEDNAEAGKNLVARLSFKNSGVVPLEGILAKVSIPELGISSVKFVDQIKNSGKLSEVREDFILKILDNVQSGTYTVRSEISSQFSGEKEVKEMPVFILGKSEQSIQTVNEKLVINIPVVKQDIKNDGSEAIYPIILTNEGPDANYYTLLLDGAGWADLRLSDSNAFVIRPKESKTINIYASAKGNMIGEQIFLATINSDDKMLKQIPLKGNLISSAQSPLFMSLKSILEVILIGVVILLVAIGFFFGFNRPAQVDDNGISREIPDKDQGEAYY